MIRYRPKIKDLPELEQVVTVPEAAAMCNVSKQAVNEWIMKGYIIARQSAKIWIISLKSLQEFMEAREEKMLPLNRVYPTR